AGVGMVWVQLFIEQYALFCLIGVVVGILSGLLGIGGGIVLVPMLHTILVAKGFAADAAFHTALATSMACIVFTSLSSIAAHHKNLNIVWPYVWSMVPMAFIGSLLATLVAIHLDAFYLTLFFATFTFFAAIQLFLDRKPTQHKVPGKVEISLVSLVIGVISALVSIGGGTLTVPYLAMRNVSVKQAIGTSAVLGFPIALASTVSYLQDALRQSEHAPDTFGLLYLPAIMLITPLSVLFAPFGVALTKRFPVKVLKRIFAIFLIGVSVNLIWSQLV
ncbi:MAG: sulfite exporter TauE/SafE family protein, partial [Methylophilus sp.]